MYLDASTGGMGIRWVSFTLLVSPALRQIQHTQAGRSENEEKAFIAVWRVVIYKVATIILRPVECHHFLDFKKWLSNPGDNMDAMVFAKSNIFLIPPP